jgi:UDP-N-acetylmuramoyl-L-alanyl-D-glutamate--2,6-diaminopimelate ligase
MSLKSKLRTLIPTSALLRYHQFSALIASTWYGNPSRKLVVIGVTGTKGKSTTCNYIWSVLQHSGKKTALTGTANFRIGTTETLNPYHLSMPGAWIIQKFLRRAVQEGCTHAVIEVTSEGLKQWRHAGIQFDSAVFTNLTPEHLPSHNNSFDEYRAAKLRLFTALCSSLKSNSCAVLNNDSSEVAAFAAASPPRRVTYATHAAADLVAKNIQVTATGGSFQIDDTTFTLQIPGFFNVSNAVAAIAVGRALGMSLQQCVPGIAALTGVPGRMEAIDMGQSFSLWVDYAHEKESMGGLLNTLRAIRTTQEQKIIVLLGAEGGGRDKSKRPIMGEQVGQQADYVIVSNVDPYEDDPTPICEDIAVAAEAAGMKRNENLFVIEDRRSGIAKAISLARPGDLVAITGKGAEQSIVIGGKSAPWDDRTVVREELTKMPNTK